MSTFRTAKDDGVKPERLIDLVPFYLGFTAYLEWVEENGQKDAFLNRGLMFARRYMSTLNEGTNQHIKPIVSRADAARLKPAFHKFDRSGSPADRAVFKADFFNTLFGWFRAHQEVFRNTFPGKARKAGMSVMRLVDEDSPISIVSQAAAIPAVSGLQAPRKWLAQAAERMGAALSNAETTMADVESLSNVAAEVLQVDAEIAGAAPNSDKAATLLAKKAALIAKMEDNAEGDTGLLQAAAAAAFKPHSGHQTATGGKLSLNAQQEAAMMATGKKVIAAGAGSGKCVRGDTLIQTAQGFVEIQELGGGLGAGEDASLEMWLHGAEGVEQSSHIYRDGVGPTVQVQTRYGFELEATPAHRIKILQEGGMRWVHMRDLQEGDLVCIDRRQGLFAESPFEIQPLAGSSIPNRLNKRVAALLGYIVSEGYIQKQGYGISLRASDAGQINKYRECLTGCNISVGRGYPDERGTTQNRKTFTTLSFLRKSDIGTLCLLGLQRVGAQDKEIPVGILQSPRPIVREFLRALFEGDERNVVSYCTTSTVLARQLQTVLLAFGVVARREFRPNAKLGAWSLTISGGALRVFERQIGPDLEREQTKLKQLASRDPNTNVDVIPTKALCGSWFFDPITDIQQGEADTYDFVVPRTQSFSGGGFINHNTRILAGEIAYRINEMGYDASSICAASFTRKSSKELIRRARSYGAVIDGAAASGFGTTHYLAGVTILGKLGKGTKRPKYFSKKQQWAVTTLTAIAVRQVSMKGNGAKAPNPRNPYTDRPTQIPQTARDTPVPNFEGETNPETQKLVGILKDGIRLFSTGWPSWFKGGDWGRWATKFLTDMVRRLEDGADVNDFSQRQRDQINKLMRHIQKEYGVGMRVGAAEDAPDAEVQGAGKPDIARKGNTKYQYWDMPARQWFNIGMKWEGAGDKKGQEGQQFSAAGVKRKIDIWKGMGASPEEVWYAAGAMEGKIQPYAPEAAAYAAYEWLKGSSGEPDFRNTGDMSDLIGDAVRTLIHNDKARAALQSRFKVILIDEAQDLNATQHILFSLLAGAIDHETLEPKPEGEMTADTFGFVGDDKQCVSVDAEVLTPDGLRFAGELRVGDKVISNRNGSLVPQTVNHVAPSSWTEGLKVTTESGHSLLMSPNHRLWATSPETEGDQMVVYLMYRKDMGFRVGITNKGKVGSEGDYLNSFGGRAFLEKAERLWVLDICADRDAALLKEYQTSLRYSIPTMVFNGEHRGLNQSRIDTIFKEFGANGARLLEDRHLSADYPHWMSQSYTKHGRERHTINLIAHSSSNTQVAMEWSGDKFDSALEGFGVRTAKDNRRRLRRWFANYREALQCASAIKEKTGAQVSHRLATPDGPVREIPASGLFVGMSLPVHNGANGIELDRIVSIEKAPGQFVDIDVGDASNFFAGGILTHNSIYEFRGAEPDEFIDKSDLVPGGQDYETHILDINYRSGQAIVEAANQLIKHNSKQIPMTCKANYEVKGDGSIKAESFSDPADAADMVAETIFDYAEANATADAKYSNYGIAVRSNAEAMHYALGMVKRAIPFKSKANPFKSPPIKSMLGWMSFVEGGPGMDRASFLAAAGDSLRMPVSYLGKAFMNKLGQQRIPLDWLKNIDPYQEFRGNYAKNVDAFIGNLSVCFSMHGSPDAPEDVYASLQTRLKSSGGKSFFDGIVDNIKQNNDKMAELAAENPDGIPTDEQIREAAEEDLVLLNGLMGAKDSVDGVMEYVRELKAVNEKVSTGEDEDRDAVTIGTMHSWKGLECPKLFIPLVRGKFPRVKLEKNPDTGEFTCTKPNKDDPALASERRLAYVAITRAEDSCVLMDIANPSKAFAGCPPSQFIEEACVAYSDEEVPEGEAKAAADELTTLWENEYHEDWGIVEPTTDEIEEARMLHDMQKMNIEEEPEDPMLAMWLKATGTPRGRR